MAIAQVKNGPITYTGFEENDNGKFFVSDEGDYIRIRYQINEFSQALFTIKRITHENLQEQLDNRYFSKRDIPCNIMECIKNGETVYWYHGDPFSGRLHCFGTDLNKIIDAEKNKMLKEYQKSDNQ